MTGTRPRPGAAAGFRALRTGPLTLRLLDAENLPDVVAAVAHHPDAAELEAELRASYVPRRPAKRRRKYGFATERDGVIVGFSLLDVDSWRHLRGSTGADTIAAFRGRGIAPSSKPALFHLGFALLGLHRIETGCLVSNAASRRSIEKTPGFVYEGTTRESGRRDDGTFEDELRWAILRRDWERLYDPAGVEVIR